MPCGIWSYCSVHLFSFFAIRLCLSLWRPRIPPRTLPYQRRRLRISNRNTLTKIQRSGFTSKTEESSQSSRRLKHSNGMWREISRLVSSPMHFCEVDSNISQSPRSQLVCPTKMTLPLPVAVRHLSSSHRNETFTHHHTIAAFRAWTLMTVFVMLFSGANQFFGLRYVRLTTLRKRLH